MSQEDNGQVWPPSSGTVQAGPLTGEPAKLEGQQLDVHKCAACDGRHDAIQVQSFNRPVQPYTHWYQCPTLGDPVPISIAMLTAGDAIELDGPVCQALAEAQIAGRWLVAVFHIDVDGRLILRRSSQKFPTGDLLQSAEHKGCIGLLKENFEQEVGTQQPQEMRTAATPRPLRSLMGAAVQCDAGVVRPDDN